MAEFFVSRLVEEDLVVFLNGYCHLGCLQGILHVLLLVGSFTFPILLLFLHDMCSFWPFGGLSKDQAKLSSHSGLGPVETTWKIHKIQSNKFQWICHIEWQTNRSLPQIQFLCMPIPVFQTDSWVMDKNLWIVLKSAHQGKCKIYSKVSLTWRMS